MKIVFKLLRYSGLPFLFRELIQRNKVTIMMFHDVDKKVAHQSFQYLSRYYNIIPLQQFQQALEAKSTEQLPKKAMVITFDDGHKQNFDIVPILDKFQVPATIFLCSGIINTHRHYWFKANSTGSPTDELKKLTNQQRLEVLATAGFEQEKEYQERHALSQKEIEAMRTFVDFQAHTIFHPCLPTCEDQESWNEIATCKTELENQFQLEINAFAYPNGDYGQREVNYLQKAGYQLAVTVEPGYNTVSSDPFRLKRLSSNDTADMNELIVKSSGLWGMIKKWTSSSDN